MQVQVNNELDIQWSMSNPTYKGTREMCRIVQDVGILRFYFRINEKYTKTNSKYILMTKGRRGRDRMVVGFITIYAISVYHH
jgi:hypothetical protein